MCHEAVDSFDREMVLSVWPESGVIYYVFVTVIIKMLVEEESVRSLTDFA